MEITYKNYLIRNASVQDAALLCKWWNDGAIMAHAGFPNGTGQSAEEISEKISHDTDDSCRRLIIELDKTPIGEMSYKNLGDGRVEIGIKICDISKQERGHGRILLSMLFHELLHEKGYSTIVISTDMENLRAQHVYELLGARKLRTVKDAWRSPTGKLHSAVEYELNERDFINYAI